MKRHLFSPLLLLLICVLFTGCGSGSRVSGTVTFEDGTPLQLGTVVFTSGDKTYSGTIKNGTYALGVTKNGQKIPPGSYKIYLADTTRTEILYDKNGEETLNCISFTQILPGYASPESGLLAVDVQGSKTFFDITVKKHPDADKRQKYGPNGSETAKRR